MPQIVKAAHLRGRAFYESRYAPYVPRNYSDLELLQILCGDHSERDVSVVTSKGKLIRPWLSVWQDLRTGLIWGWHLDLAPSSQTVALAYAKGVKDFGAQPVARPEEDFSNYIYTDRDRTYRSHQWDGRVVAVHRRAMNITGDFELLLTERQIGIVADLMIGHLLARPRNAKEKPVERFFKDVSFWEENRFPEYCGRDAKSRPDAWEEFYRRHLKFVKGESTASPFMPFERYREELASFIARYNSSEHERVTLGGKRIVPLEEFHALYNTRYEISPEKVALLLLKPRVRVIEKDGVECFRKGWFYFHDAMSKFKKASVAIRFTDDDYTHVWAKLPDGDVVKAELITPTSLLHPNKETLKRIARARANERTIIRDFEMIQRSRSRAETIEERVMRDANQTTGVVVEMSADDSRRETNVYQLSEFDRRRRLHSLPAGEVMVEETACAAADDALSREPRRKRIREFDFDE